MVKSIEIYKIHRTDMNHINKRIKLIEMNMKLFENHLEI